MKAKTSSRITEDTSFSWPILVGLLGAIAVGAAAWGLLQGRVFNLETRQDRFVQFVKESVKGLSDGLDAVKASQDQMQVDIARVKTLLEVMHGSRRGDKSSTDDRVSGSEGPDDSGLQRRIHESWIPDARNLWNEKHPRTAHPLEEGPG